MRAILTRRSKTRAGVPAGSYGVGSESLTWGNFGGRLNYCGRSGRRGGHTRKLGCGLGTGEDEKDFGVAMLISLLLCKRLRFLYGFLKLFFLRMRNCVMHLGAIGF